MKPKKIEGQRIVECAFWNESEVATHLGMSVQWLRKMRDSGSGIPHQKFGASVRYQITDVEAYVKASTFDSTSARSSESTGKRLRTAGDR